MKRGYITLVIHRPPDRRDTFIHRLIKDTPTLIISEFRFDMKKPFLVDGKVAIIPGDHGLLFEYLRGYEIIAVAHQGILTGYYLNINLPFERVPDGYVIKDLFLDIWVWPDGTYHILDDDEFREACEKGWISEKEKTFALKVLNLLLTRIRKKAFPPGYVVTLSKKWVSRGIRTSAE
jgi:predicted RNA-binding protein associated with RNAse of E/G family